MLLLRMLLHIILIGFMSCSGSRGIVEKNMETVVQATLGDKYTCTPNQTESYYLCQAEDSLRSGTMWTYFIVIDSAAVIVLDRDKIYGKVSWRDDTSLRITKYPMVVLKGEDVSTEVSYISIFKSQ